MLAGDERQYPDEFGMVYAFKLNSEPFAICPTLDTCYPNMVSFESQNSQCDVVDK
jgi:hypothetical protein